MRTKHRPRGAYRLRARRDRPARTSAWTLDLDIVDLMLDLDPGMLDHSWLEDPPR